MGDLSTEEFVSTHTRYMQKTLKVKKERLISTVYDKFKAYATCTSTCLKLKHWKGTKLSCLDDAAGPTSFSRSEESSHLTEETQLWDVLSPGLEVFGAETSVLIPFSSLQGINSCVCFLASLFSVTLEFKPPLSDKGDTVGLQEMLLWYYLNTGKLVRYMTCNFGCTYLCHQWHFQS